MLAFRVFFYVLSRRVQVFCLFRSSLTSFRCMKSIVGLHLPFRRSAPVFSSACTLFFVWVQANESFYARKSPVLFGKKEQTDAMRLFGFVFLSDGRRTFPIFAKRILEKDGMKSWILIALGGGVGSVLRHLTVSCLSKCGWAAFPLGTFAVNAAGCFLVGLLFGLSARLDALNQEWRLFLQVGFCGGYTTFSAFSLENVKLFESGHYATLALYVAGSLGAGVLAVWAGYALVGAVGK